MTPLANSLVTLFLLSMYFSKFLGTAASTRVLLLSLISILMTQQQSSCAESTVKELHAAYVDMQSRLDGISVTTEFSGFQPKNSRQLLPDALAAGLPMLRANVEMQNQFRADMKKNGVVIGEGFGAIEEYIKGRVTKDQAMNALKANVNAKHEFTLGAIRQVKAYLDADQLKLADSGRDFRLLQYGLTHEKVAAPSQRWTCLDERMPNGHVWVWCKTSIAIDGMVPPGFDHHSLESRYPSGLYDLWERPEELVNYGVIESGNHTIQLIGRTLENGPILLAAFPGDSVSSFPLWIGRFKSLSDDPVADSGEKVKFNDDSIRRLLERVERVSEDKSFNCKSGELYPGLITFFSGRKEVAGIESYPTKTSQFVIGLGKTSGDDRELSAVNGYHLAINDIKRISDGALDPIKIVDGVGYLDKDSDVSYVIGQDQAQQIMGLAGNASGRIFLWINIILVTILGVLVYLRSRRASRA